MPNLCDAFGDTKLVLLPAISSICGAKIYVKLENTNPGGGSVKDRVALNLIRCAERQGKLSSGGTVVEGTGGNTGLGLVTVANALGYKTILTMPEAISRSKINHMRALGADVRLCPPVPHTDPAHYAQLAAHIGKTTPKAFHTDQFKNLSNMETHVLSTAPEIERQLKEAEGTDVMRLDAFVAAAGTGGTIGGCGKYFKSVSPNTRIVLSDCDGSCLKTYIATGELKQREGEAGTTAEGIGCGRLTGNFAEARKFIDGAINVSDIESITVAINLLKLEGVFAGPSAALNVAGAMKVARRLREVEQIEEPVVVTIICDSGASYMEKCYDEAWRKEKGFAVEPLGDGESLLDRLDEGSWVNKANEAAFVGHVGGS